MRLLRPRRSSVTWLPLVLLAGAGAMLSAQIVHPLAQPAYDQGPVEATFRLGYMQMMFQQTPAQHAALDQLLAAQRDPSSPAYHTWLTPEQYADRFGVSAADLARVAAWLRSAGFTIDYTARGRDFIAFSGTAAQVGSAFHTSVHRYTVGGKTHFAVATEPAIPSEFTPLVATILGLNDFYPKSMLKPAYTSGSGVLLSPSLAPGDLDAIYHISPLLQQGVDGAGEKIAIVGESAVQLSDIQQFRANYGLASGKITMIQIGTPGTDPDDQVEADLDLEWAGAIAPNATLLYVYGADAGSAALYAIDQNLAPVVSMSFGLCEAYLQPSMPAQYEAEAKKGNAMGITWVASSGDSGAAACDPAGSPYSSYGLAVNFPASIPEVTAVGGAEFNEGSGNYWGSTNGVNGGSALGYVPEMAWNDTGALSNLCNYNPLPDGSGAATCSGLASTGGGVSMLFPKPAWQVGPGVPSDGQRDVPDIALAASDLHDPYNIVSSGQTMQVGGTSASAPVFAGMLALLNQQLKGSGVGNINATLYGLALSSPSMFHDIVNNNNIVPCACGDGDVGYDAGVAYDLTTGLGSVDVYNLASGWTAATASGPAPVISSVANAASYAAGIVAPGEMVVISGTGLAPAQMGGLAMTAAGLVSTQYSTNALIDVQFNGVAAPLIYTSSTAIAAVVPYEVAGSSTAQVTVTYQGKTSAPAAVSVAAAVPGIFTANASGSGQASAFNANGTTPNSSAAPAAQGSPIILYGTGEGQTSPGGVDGMLAVAPLPAPVLPISVTIGGVPAVVQYAGPAYGEVSGMLQINAIVPSSVSGSAVPVVVEAGNTMSQAGVTIAVAPPAFAVTSQEIVGSILNQQWRVGLFGAALRVFIPDHGSGRRGCISRLTARRAGDVFVADFLNPSGQLDPDQPSLTLSYSGSGCAAAPLTIAGSAVAQEPGGWQVKMFRNGAFLFALPFTIVP